MTLDEQVNCVRREIALRRNVYAKRIEAGKLTQEAATRELTLMQAVLVTLTVNYPQALAKIRELQIQLAEGD